MTHCTQTQVEFQIPVMEPVFSKNININIMDYNILSRNDRIASLKIDYAALKKQWDRHMTPQWVYAYGAPRGKQSGYARKMNKGLVQGSNFRGKLFMECKVKKVEKKQKKRVTENVNDLLDEGRHEMVEYYLKADLYEGTEINQIKGAILDHKMFVMVSVNEVTAMSTDKKVKDKNSSVEWYESLMSDGNPDKCIGPFLLPKRWESDPRHIDLPDVFIYLCVRELNKIEQVSYRRVPLNQIIPGPTGKGTYIFQIVIRCTF